MAKTTHIAHAEWEKTYNAYLRLTQKLGQAQPHERDALERQIAAVQEDLLDTPAPHATAVLRKFELLFEGDLHGLDRASEERRLILEDFENLIRAQHQLLGV